jgi:hypothetical protein
MMRALALFTLVALVACAKGAATGPGGGGPKLAMVSDTGGLGDKSFNDSAYAGLMRAKVELGATIEVQESKSAADYQPNLTALADGDFDEIFAIGFLMNNDLTDVAKNYPNTHFAIIDAVNPEPNVTSVVFREQDGSFLAGALAAMVTKTKTIGFLGGIDSPLLRKFETGFTAGAHQVDPNVKVLVKYVGSFVDVSSGKELAGVMYGYHLRRGRQGRARGDRRNAFAFQRLRDRRRLRSRCARARQDSHEHGEARRRRGFQDRASAPSTPDACANHGVRPQRRRRRPHGFQVHARCDRPGQHRPHRATSRGDRRRQDRAAADARTTRRLRSGKAVSNA